MSLEKIQEVEEIVALMMESTIESLKRDLSTIHAGRVSPSMLDNVKVDYYGNLSPINQVANICTPEPQLLAISPWEKKMIKEIERSLQAANLGLISLMMEISYVHLPLLSLKKDVKIM